MDGGGGCTSTPARVGFGSISTDSISPYYTPSTVFYAPQLGTLLAVAIGNPFIRP